MNRSTEGQVQCRTSRECTPHEPAEDRVPAESLSHESHRRASNRARSIGRLRITTKPREKAPPIRACRDPSDSIFVSKFRRVLEMPLSPVRVDDERGGFQRSGSAAPFSLSPTGCERNSVEVLSKLVLR